MLMSHVFKGSDMSLLMVVANDLRHGSLPLDT